MHLMQPVGFKLNSLSILRTKSLALQRDVPNSGLTYQIDITGYQGSTKQYVNETASHIRCESQEKSALPADEEASAALQASQLLDANQQTVAQNPDQSSDLTVDQNANQDSITMNQQDS